MPKKTVEMTGPIPAGLNALLDHIVSFGNYSKNELVESILYRGLGEKYEQAASALASETRLGKSSGGIHDRVNTPKREASKRDRYAQLFIDIAGLAVKNGVPAETQLAKMMKDVKKPGEDETATFNRLLKTYERNYRESLGRPQQR